LRRLLRPTSRLVPYTTLFRSEHRGAIGSDAGTGDGAGIITQIPDAFLREVTDFELPQSGRYAVGMAFLPTDATQRDAVKAGIARDRKSTRLNSSHVKSSYAVF